MDAVTIRLTLDVSPFVAFVDSRDNFLADDLKRLIAGDSVFEKAFRLEVNQLPTPANELRISLHPSESLLGLRCAGGASDRDGLVEKRV
jgi:hypothetical protein